MRIKYGSFILLLLLFLSSVAAAQYNATTVIPGNRIPYGPGLKWQRYKAHAAHFYFAAGTDSLCKYTVENYSALLKELEQESGLKARGVATVVIYPSLYRYFGTNIGSNVPARYSFPTFIAAAGGRTVLAFDGSYTAYARQLSTSIMRRLWDQNIGHTGRTNLPNHIPAELKWFREGLIHYFSEGFSLADNDSLYHLLAKDTVRSIDSLLRDADQGQQLLLAKGFCWFLTQHYRKDVLKQVTFQLKQKKSLGAALRLVTKREWRELELLYAAFLKHIYSLPEPYFSGQYQPAATMTRKPEKHNILVATDSSWTVYAAVKNGKKSICRKQKDRSRSLRSFQVPLWLEGTAVRYPLVAHDKDKLFLLFLQKGVHKVTVHDRSGRTIRTVALPRGIDGVTSFKISKDGSWLMTAYTKGRSDIISFDPKTFRVRALSNDLADNTELSIEAGDPDRITYRSGFPKTMNPDTTIKNISKAKEPGIYSRSVNKKDGGEQLVALDADTFERDLALFAADERAVPSFRHYWSRSYLQNKSFRDSLEEAEQKRKEEAAEGQGFLSGLLGQVSGAKGKDTVNGSAYQPKNVRPYLLQLSRLWVNASVNNDHFINRLQPYQAQLGIYKFPEIGGMLTGGYTDVFEDHEFNAGYKMPAGTEGSDLFFRYKNKKHRMDWSVLYHRKVESLRPDPARPWLDPLGRPYPPTAKVKSHYYEAGLRYPVSYRSRIELSAALRENRTVFLSTDRYSLEYPDLNDLWNINTISYTYNDIEPGQAAGLMLRGLRYHAGMDVVLGLGKNNDSRFSYGITQSVDWYLPLNPWLNWRNQLHVGYSGGSEYLLYNFGGMNNNVIVRVDSNAVFEQNAPYLFQQLVTPLRGFQQNTMWGNAYGMINTELFAQVCGGLLPVKTKFQFVNLMQLGVFADRACSKATWDPDAHWQRRNSYGISLKTLLANYPVRVDLAFPYDLGHKPMVHLSLSL